MGKMKYLYYMYLINLENSSNAVEKNIVISALINLLKFV
jgi:hypothetical protein